MPKRYALPAPQEWLDLVTHLRGTADISVLQSAMALYLTAVPCSDRGLSVADILLSLGIDNTTLAVALIYPLAQEKNLKTPFEWLGEEGNKLLQDVLQMQSLGRLQQVSQRDMQQTENLRKMLLAMMTDVRAVLIILAERLSKLRQAKLMNKESQRQIAQETLDVYAPLANRLGVWQLKWEIEDLCLRYLQPETYMQIAKGLAAKRDERETYIQKVTTALSDMLHQAGLKGFEVNGRVKHIYSIYKKMQRKRADLPQIYDVSALRVLVSTIDDCYAVLSILHNAWQQFPDEFDDYISHPKPNGYQSIHTVVQGPQHHFIEVQIRTHQMHHESELGVAAHWRYKEGVLEVGNYEAKIALLRQVLAWQKEVMSSKIDKGGVPLQDLFADRIYVFTPMGEIVDLEKGATPLDFAYHIHSEVGHRCRGAKVDGNIVPLTYVLQTGARIEILTAKHANPSRDWLSSQLGFLKTARARSKVQHWFRVKDSEQNRLLGREILDRELKRMGCSDKFDLQAIALKLNFKTDDSLLSALGSGDLRLAQIMHFVQLGGPPDETIPIMETKLSEGIPSNIQMLGINNLLTHMARCCKPLPGDAIVGYVTRNRGISVHRRDCNNVRHVIKDNQSKCMEVNWGEKQLGTYPTDLILRVYDRAGLLRDITTLLASEKINVSGLTTQKAQDAAYVDIYITIETSGREQLNQALNLLQHVPNIVEVRRR